VVVRETGAEETEELGEAIREVFRVQRVFGTTQREGRQAVGAGGAPDAEIDAARVQSLEQPERLGDRERAVVRQHHPTGADANALGGRRHPLDEQCGHRARQTRCVVVLGQPEADQAPPLRQPRELDRCGNGLCGRAPRRHRAQVEHREG
jgi:hypothetical protein